MFLQRQLPVAKLKLSSLDSYIPECEGHIHMTYTCACPLHLGMFASIQKEILIHKTATNTTLLCSFSEWCCVRLHVLHYGEHTDDMRDVGVEGVRMIICLLKDGQQMHLKLKGPWGDDWADVVWGEIVELCIRDVPICHLSLHMHLSLLGAMCYVSFCPLWLAGALGQRGCYECWWMSLVWFTPFS